MVELIHAITCIIVSFVIVGAAIVLFICIILLNCDRLPKHVDLGVIWKEK